MSSPVLVLTVNRTAADRRPHVLDPRRELRRAPGGRREALAQRPRPLAHAVHNSERPWIAVGPTFGAMLYNQVQIELGAIYKPVRFETDTLACANGDCTQRVPSIAIHESVRGHLWEFPLTANYYFGRNRIRPYAGGGIVLRQDFGGKCDVRVTDQATGNAIVSQIPESCFPLLGLLQHEPSVVMDVGLRWSHSRLKIQPEFRYTRHRPQAQPDPRTPRLVVPRADQLDFLAGFSFEGKDR